MKEAIESLVMVGATMTIIVVCLFAFRCACSVAEFFDYANMRQPFTDVTVKGLWYELSRE